MTKGELVMKKLKEKEKRDKIIKKKKEKLKDKYFPYANEGICFDCGKKLIHPEETVCFVEGEYGDTQFYIHCPCGFNFSTMNDEKDKIYREYYQELKQSNLPKVKKNLLQLLRLKK